MANVAQDTMTAAIKAFAAQHGLSAYDAEQVLASLRLGADDLAYVAEHPDRTAALDLDTTDKTAGHSGWLVWFEPNDTATYVTNGEPSHIDGVRSLQSAVEVVS